MSPRIPRPLLAALVLPLVVIVGFQSAWAAFACRVDGEVRDHCCCKSASTEREKPAGDAPRMAAPSCCDVTIHERSEAPAVREVDRAELGHVPLVIPAAAYAIVSPRIERVATLATFATLARPPPPPRRPLYLDKQALLR